MRLFKAGPPFLFRLLIVYDSILRLTKATVDNKLQAKIMEEVTNEASDLRGQQNIKVEVRTKLEAEINELRMENQEAAVHANELEIRNNLLNKLLTSERENNSKFEEIVLSKRPEMETLRIKLADVTEKYEPEKETQRER